MKLEEICVLKNRSRLGIGLLVKRDLNKVRPVVYIALEALSKYTINTFNNIVYSTR